jgi:hypothetical protein
MLAGGTDDGREERNEIEKEECTHRKLQRKIKNNNNTESDRPDAESKHEYKSAFANAF